MVSMVEVFQSKKCVIKQIINCNEQNFNFLNDKIFLSEIDDSFLVYTTQSSNIIMQ